MVDQTGWRCPRCGTFNTRTNTCTGCGSPLNKSGQAPANTPPKPSETNPMQKFLSEEQDPNIVKQVLERVKQILTREEEIIYIAVQKPVVPTLSPDCVVLTNRRFIIYKPKFLGGANFEDYIWPDLHDAHLSEGMMRATLTLKTVKGRMLSLGDLPKPQARRLYAFAQEMEERVRILRRQRDMEEKRAAAGGIIFQGQMPTSQMPSVPQVQTPAPPPEDPMQKLKILKNMLDAGLITGQEYEAKKTEILSRL
jgi:hypothetical protein